MIELINKSGIIMMEIQLIRATVKDADDFENTNRIICGTIKQISGL